ncbi:MAG: hypothetical protein WDA75_18785 [Candidatus Latescibacterota bacterium]|jgi:hypothetical protein
MSLTLCCREQNDLYQVLIDRGVKVRRCDSLAEALTAAEDGGAVLALADTYPRPELVVTEQDLRQAATKGLRLYLEYPAAVAGLVLGEPRATQWERVVTSSEFFAPEVAQHRILALHGCYYLPVQAQQPVEKVALSGEAEGWRGLARRASDSASREDAQSERNDARARQHRPQPEWTFSTGCQTPHLVVARVAGYHTAVYGLPEDASPILFELPGHLPVLVATSKLSQFITARYGPVPAWQAIWQTLLRWLDPTLELPALTWTPAVRVQAGPREPIPAAAEAAAFGRSVAWFREHVVFSTDWKKGALEGFEAGIDWRGRQYRRAWVRGDCTGESAQVFAWDWAVRGNPASRTLAGQMLDYVFSTPDFHHDDPTDPAYGLNNWYERGPVYYGDDNARVLLPALAAARLLDDNRWDERILRCLLANLRTTGRLGFRRARIDQHQFAELGGWTFFREEEHVHYAPHYQAYLWAAFLWAYALTGHREFLEKPRQALRMTMAAYPDQWQWTNGLSQEIARVILPLAFLVRVDDTPEHRGWLERMVGELIALMQPCGAIQEKLGAAGRGSYGPPASNEAYGTNEATLMQSPDDPVCDLLYTTNYALVGLHEAAASGSSTAQVAVDRLTAFLCRIQVRSEAQPYLDGAWMRSFDYQLWEYWGSSADLGWGAWSVESGWTNAWIASILAMRGLGRCLWDTSLAGRLSSRFPTLLEEMLRPGPAVTPAGGAPAAGRVPGAE